MILFSTDPRHHLLIIARLILICLLLPAATANAADLITLQTPEQVGVGQPFLVRMTSRQPLTTVTVKWKGTEVSPSMAKSNGQHDGLLILGVGLNDATGNYPLTVSVSDGSATQQLKRQITVVDTVFAHETLTVDSKHVTPPDEVMERIQKERTVILEAIRTVSPKRHWELPFSRPVKGKMLSRFGLRRVFNGETKRRHKGLDFRAWEGTPIHAMAAGRVVLAGNFYFAGNSVFIDHGNGLISMSCHMSKLLVKTGDSLVAGQKIGLSGATGRVNGAHLHLSVFALGTSIDPEPFFALETASVFK